MEKKEAQAKVTSQVTSPREKDNNIWNFSLDVICVIDQEERFIQVSRASENIWGYTSDELIGKSYMELIHPDDKDITIKQSLLVKQGISTLHFENRYLHKDGHIVYMMWSAYWSEENHTTYCIARDITENKKMSNLLKEQEKKFKVLIEKISEVIYLKDPEGVITYVSPSLKKTLGYTSEEFCGKNFTGFIHTDDLSSSLEMIEELRKNPGQTHNFQRRMKHKNGEWIWVEGSVTNLLSETSVNSMVCNFRDISDRKSMELTLERLYGDLETKAQALKGSNDELERFAYIASHDLQEPLRMITSFLQLLEMKYKDKLDEQAGKYIFFAKDGAERMKLLIENLLDYSRIDSIKENLQLINTTELMQEMLSLFEIPIKDTNTVVEISGLPAITGIKSQIRQLFQNLLGNALKYKNIRGEQPHIKISSYQSDSHWVFRIEDNGIGIEPHFIDKVFILFQRLHTRNEYSGTGIGLAISKKIIEKHQGKIWVESIAGQGSNFFFSISKNLNSLNSNK
ncbi:MAG: PAS domain S-box protein [Cytophagaceae bacterium]